MALVKSLLSTLHPAPAFSARMRIYLTGFMGAGKTYVGHRLAKKIGLPFVDTDARVETLTGKTISNIFAEYGEATFRDLETQTLFSGLPDEAVVATGGGAPCFNGNMEHMNKSGVTVFLDPPEAVLLSRLTEGRGHRPLLQSDTELRNLIQSKLATRRAVYETAQIHLQGDQATTDAVGTILAKLDDGFK